MSEHPVLERYASECVRIRKWYGLAPDDDPMPMNLAMHGRIPPPTFNMNHAMLMDDMALAIRQLAALAQKAGAEYVFLGYVSRHWHNDRAKDSQVSVTATPDASHSVSVYVASSAPGGGGEVQPFVTCRCHDDRAKELCLDKHRCVRVSAQGSISPKEQV